MILWYIFHGLCLSTKIISKFSGNVRKITGITGVIGTVTQSSISNPSRCCIHSRKLNRRFQRKYCRVQNKNELISTYSFSSLLVFIHKKEGIYVFTESGKIFGREALNWIFDKWKIQGMNRTKTLTLTFLKYVHIRVTDVCPKNSYTISPSRLADAFVQEKKGIYFLNCVRVLLP